MKLQNQKAFTLVELIVVITILAILATIAFISFTGYSQNSRDSKRIADINSIQKSLELYVTEKGTYPIPDNNASITYSGATAWIEGTVGDNVMINIENINKKPIDPLSENEYTYSITSAKTEYQIGAISESGQMGYKLPVNQTYAAASKKGTAMIRGTYNERFLKVQSGTINRILALPSIIATDITETELLTILSNKKLVYNNYQNIPHSYNNMGYVMTGGFDYTNTNPQVYSGSMKTLTDDNEEKKIFISNLKTAYNGTILHGGANYKDIVNSDIDANSTGAINTVISFINSNVGGIKVSNTILTMLSSNGTSPIVVPGLITQIICTNAGWAWISSTNDMLIGSTNGNGFCISPTIDIGDSTGQGISWNGRGYKSANASFNGWNSDLYNPNISDTNVPDNTWGGQTRNITNVVDSTQLYMCVSLGTATAGFRDSSGVDNMSGQDTLENRMRYISYYKTDSTKLSSIDWISANAKPVGHLVYPAMYLADCLDGIKDIGTDMLYKHSDNSLETITYTSYKVLESSTISIDLSNITYQNREKYLQGWTQKSGSHLPSAYSSITNGSAGTGLGEYQKACNVNQTIAGTNDQTTGERIWLSSIGSVGGSSWGISVRQAGATGCDSMDYFASGVHYNAISARFIVRP